MDEAQGMQDLQRRHHQLGLYLEHYPRTLIIVTLVQAEESKVEVQGESLVASIELVKEEVEERGLPGREEGVKELTELKSAETLI
ncbi:ribonuclease J [Sesbania bispinosa]|nr:ribonuclease J [Sesbania bispinosa]